MFDAVLGGVIARRRRRRGNLASMPVMSLRDPVRGRGNLRQKSLAASFGDRRVTAFLAMTRTGRSAHIFFVIKQKRLRAADSRPYARAGT